jgi:hypothetical protein
MPLLLKKLENGILLMYLVTPFSLCICGYVREKGVFRSLQQSKSITAKVSYLPTKEGLASFSRGSNQSFSIVNTLGELNTHLPKKKYILSQNGNDVKLYNTQNVKLSPFLKLCKNFVASLLLWQQQQ